MNNYDGYILVKTTNKDHLLLEFHDYIDGKVCNIKQLYELDGRGAGYCYKLLDVGTLPIETQEEIRPSFIKRTIEKLQRRFR